MNKGCDLSEALGLSLRALDGVFTYLIATADHLGMAKDSRAIKPLAAVEEADQMAIATEEQALRKVFPHEVPVHTYDGPNLTATWGVKVPVP
jgi:glutamine phosphoribosylpyrophosphate amidotransferase